MAKITLFVILVSLAAITYVDGDPSIVTNNGDLHFKLDTNAQAVIQGNLHVDRSLTLSGLNNTVVDELAVCKTDVSTLRTQLSTLSATFNATLKQMEIQFNQTLRNMIEAVVETTKTSVQDLDQKIDLLETADNDLEQSIIQSQKNSEVFVRKHVEAEITEVTEDISQSQEGLANLSKHVNASFDEVDDLFAASGLWEYTFSGQAAINKEFSYWFSIDYAGQGANDTDGTHQAGVSDSMQSGNWFLNVEASSGHCGGGCHVDYFQEKTYFNGYCSKTNLYYNHKAINTGGSAWSLDRVADGHNGHAATCGTFKVRHRRGGYSFGGSYRIKVQSSKPLVVLHSYPFGDCQFRTSGTRTCGGCVSTVFASNNCKGHQIPPGDCKRGVPGTARLGLMSDPKDPKYNKNLPQMCCLNCN
eukprot:m.257250 g.257250  ORF g.257250 m.257250 type:complete len:415 (-) comp35094_c0_seq1:202-1446(-)